ncbi:MAG TPA: oligosaccharide flippase family protein [Geminicoccaceae bacterium]|mgnify:FL=1|nr:oligosaccharide flippase family protein [Geminicoccus sp.]HMU50281.1 oligosaccharide flippase family protein [Geminicoccaceae bacterium]
MSAPAAIGRALGGSFGLLLGGRVVTMALALAATVVLTRGLGAEGFGLYRTVVAYLGFVSIVASLGLNLLVVREISRAGADQGRILGHASGLRLVSGLAVIALAVAVGWLLPFEPPVRAGIALGAAGSLAFICYQLLVGLFQQRLRQLGTVAAEVAGALVLLGGAAALAAAGADLLAFVAVTALSQLCTLVVGWWFAQRLQPFRPQFDRAEWARLLRASIPIGAMTMLSVTYVRADTLLLAMLAAPQQVGLYGLASRLLDTVTGVTLMLTGLVAPLVTRHARHDPAAFRDFLGLGLTAALVWTVGVAALAGAHAGDLAALIGGAGFRAAGPPLALLTLVAPIGAVSVLFRDAAIALDRQGALLKGYLAAVAVAVAGYLLLIPRFDAVGAALGLMLGEATVAVSAFLVVHRETGVVPPLALPLRTVASGAVAAAACWGMRQLGTPWPVSLVAGAALYGGLLLATRVVAPATLWQYLGRKPAGVGENGA